MLYFCNNGDLTYPYSEYEKHFFISLYKRKTNIGWVVPMPLENVKEMMKWKRCTNSETHSLIFLSSSLIRALRFLAKLLACFEPAYEL